MGRSVQTLLPSTELTNDTLAVNSGASYIITDIDWGEVSSYALGRTVSDGVTTKNSATVTSLTAAFVAGDVGKLFSAPQFPFGTRIIAVNSGTSITVGKIVRNSLNEHVYEQAPASASATGVAIVIGVIKDNGAA